MFLIKNFIYINTMRNTFSRLAGAAVFGAATLCFNPGVLADGSCPIALKAVATEDAALRLVERAVEIYKLTPLANECLSFETFSQSADAGYLIDVREKHTQQCGGDPMVAPRLFSVQVRPNGRLTTDAYRLDRVYRPLVCPRKRRVDSL